MNPDREKSAQFLFTAALTGLALLSANERIAGFGVDLAASLAEKVLGHVCQRLLGEPWRLTHDLQQALRRAFFKAIKELERDYHNTPQYSKLKCDNQEAAWQVLEYFKLLRQGASNFFATIFSSEAGTHLTEGEQVQQLLYGDEEKTRGAVARYLQELFYGGRGTGELFVRRGPLYEGGEHLLDFLKPRLIDRWVFCFNEELKGDKPENRRAWIAFEQLFWEGLRRDLLDYLEKTYKLTEAAKPLQVDLRSRFDELLQDHALFGGRADAVAVIQQFIADPHGGYLFITGLSGYGKTALLAQWVRRYGAVYHFINQVYGTDDEDFFLRNLCQQLVACHKLGGRLPIPTTELQDLYPSLLRLPPPNGQTVVLVIDGLDEAGWEWARRPNYFPSHLPYGVKVIFSAREVADRDWPSYLHLPRERVQQLELGAMKAEDVRSLLRVAGGTVAHLADNDAWIHEAQRVSNGDPFYLRLLVEDIRDGRIQPEAIEAQPVGLDEYLKSWWNQIDTEALADEVYDLLATLAAARGRLQRRDLQIMFPKLGLKWSGVLKKVHRFVIGNEREGYLLCHPRFTEYVRQLAEPDIQRYADILLAYCAKWPEHQSPYAMAHYAGHLAEAGREVELWNLLAATPDWLKEQTRYDPSRRQYVQDLEVAILLSAQGGIDRLPEVVAYSLLRATLGSQVTEVPAEVLGLMTSVGQTEQALRFAKLATSPWRKTEAYVKIGEELLSQGSLAECVEMLSLARASAMLIADPGDRGSALSKVAKALDRAGSKEIARNVLADALGSVAAETYGITEAVLDIAEAAISIDDSGVLSQLSPIALDNKEAGSTSRGLFFCRFAVALGRGGRRDELVRFLELGPLWRISESKAFTLAWIALGLTLAGDTETADRLFDQVRSMAEHKGDYFPSLTVGDKLEAAILAARAHLGDMIDPVDALMKATSLDPYEAEQARLDQQVLHEVVQAVINSGDLKRIWALAELPGLLDFRVELLSYYAKESARLGKPNDAEKALKRALQAIDEFTERYYADWPSRVKRLRLVVETTVQLGYGQCLEEALDVAGRTKVYYGHNDYYARAKALAVVARALAHLGNKQRAQEVLLSVLQLPESPHANPSEVRAWSRMMLALAGSGDARTAKQVAQKAMKGAEIVGDCNDVIEELVAVAQGFARIQDKEGLADLLSCVRRIKRGDYARGKILIGIARAMSQIDDRLGLVDVITAAANICNDASGYCTDAASFETLVGIAHILAKVGDVDGLLRVAAAAQDLDKRTTVFGFTDVMSAVGLALVRMGELEQAGEILSRVPWEDISTCKLRFGFVPSRYNLIIYNIAQTLALTGRLDQALKLTEYMDTSGTPQLDSELDKEYLSANNYHPSRDETYVAVAVAWLSRAEFRFNQERALQEAIETVARIEGKTNRFHGLVALSRSLAKADAFPQARKVLDTALQIAETIQDNEQQSRVVIMAAETLVQIGETPQACEILAKAEYLARGIEDSEASMRVLYLLAQTMVQAGEFGRAQEIIRVVIGILESLESTQNIVESYVDCLTWFADLHVQMGEISQARELLSLAFEATERIRDESWKVAIPLMKQARIHFRINDSEKAQQIVSSALEAFKCRRYNSATGSLGLWILEYIVEVLAKSTDGCSQGTLTSVLLEVFQSARSRGRDEVLEHIAVFSTVLSKLGVATETWECIQSVESLFNRKMLSESP